MTLRPAKRALYSQPSLQIYSRQWPVNVRMPSHAEEQTMPHFYSKIPDTDNPEGFSLVGFGIGMDWNANRGIAQEQPHTLQIEGSWQDPDGRQHFPQVGTIHSPCRPPTRHMQIPSVAEPLRVEVPQIGDQHEMEQLEQWMDNMSQQARKTKLRVKKLEAYIVRTNVQDLEAYIVRELSKLHERQSGQDREFDEQNEWKRLSEHEWGHLITSVADRFQAQTDQMLVLFQKIEQDTASTIDAFSKVPTVEDSANIVRTECQQLRTEVLTQVKKLSHKEAEDRKDDRKDDQQVLLDTMRILLRFSGTLRRHNSRRHNSRRRHQTVAASTFCRVSHAKQSLPISRSLSHHSSMRLDV